MPLPLPPPPLLPTQQTALAADPADRAPGQAEPGSEDEADDAEMRKGESRALLPGRAAAGGERAHSAVVQGARAAPSLSSPGIACCCHMQWLRR